MQDDNPGVLVGCIDGPRFELPGALDVVDHDYGAPSTDPNAMKREAILRRWALEEASRQLRAFEAAVGDVPPMTGAVALSGGDRVPTPDKGARVPELVNDQRTTLGPGESFKEKVKDAREHVFVASKRLLDKVVRGAVAA